jgi:proline iminopeptidase
MFDYLAAAATGFSIGTHVRFDQRGCGRSDRAGPFTLERYLDDIADVDRHYQLERPVVAGHSFGATLALLYALARPGHVSGLLYVSGSGLGYRWRDAHHAAHDQRLTPEERRRRDELRSGSDHWSWDEEVAYRRLAYAPDVASREHASDLVESLATAPWPLNLACNAELGKQGKRDLSEQTLIERCRMLSVPVLVVHGAEDAVPIWSTDSLVEALPKARRIVLADVGHLPFVEAPSQFTGVVEPFLRACTA